MVESSFGRMVQRFSSEIASGIRKIETWKDVGQLIYDSDLEVEYVSYPFDTENYFTEDHGKKKILQPRTSPERVRAIACWWEHGGSEGWRVFVKPIYCNGLTNEETIRSPDGLWIKILGTVDDAEKCVYFLQTILNRWLVL